MLASRKTDYRLLVIPCRWKCYLVAHQILFSNTSYDLLMFLRSEMLTSVQSHSCCCDAFFPLRFSESFFSLPFIGPHSAFHFKSLQATPWLIIYYILINFWGQYLTRRTTSSVPQSRCRRASQILGKSRNGMRGIGCSTCAEF